MPIAKPQTKVYVETRAQINDPVNLQDGQSFRSFFEADKEAQALWVLQPGAREPFRVGWRQALHGGRPPPRGRKGTSRK